MERPGGLCAAEEIPLSGEYFPPHCKEATEVSACAAALRFPHAGEFVRAGFRMGYRALELERHAPPTP